MKWKDWIKPLCKICRWIQKNYEDFVELLECKNNFGILVRAQFPGFFFKFDILALILEFLSTNKFPEILLKFDICSAISELLATFNFPDFPPFFIGRQFWILKRWSKISKLFFLLTKLWHFLEFLLW